MAFANDHREVQHECYTAQYSTTVKQLSTRLRRRSYNNLALNLFRLLFFLFGFVPVVSDPFTVRKIYIGFSDPAGGASETTDGDDGDNGGGGGFNDGKRLIHIRAFIFLIFLTLSPELSSLAQT